MNTVLTQGTIDELLMALMPIDKDVGDYSMAQMLKNRRLLNAVLRGEVEAKHHYDLSKFEVATPMDEVTRALVGHHGVDVEAARLLTSIVSTVNVVAHGAQTMTLSGDGSHGVSLTRGSRITWYPMRDCIMNLDPIPSTVAVALKGRRLRDLMSHPVLDAFPLVIAGAEWGDDYTDVTIEPFGG